MEAPRECRRRRAAHSPARSGVPAYPSGCGPIRARSEISRARPRSTAAGGNFYRQAATSYILVVSGPRKAEAALAEDVAECAVRKTIFHHMLGYHEGIDGEREGKRGA